MLATLLHWMWKVVNITRLESDINDPQVQRLVDEKGISTEEAFLEFKTNRERGNLIWACIFAGFWILAGIRMVAICYAALLREYLLLGKPRDKQAWTKIFTKKPAVTSDRSLPPPIFLSNTLPPTPPIRDHDLFDQVFTHTSVHARLATRFEDPQNDPSPDNAALGFLGESILSFCITVSLGKLPYEDRPKDVVGVRSELISDTILAHIASQYTGFQERVVLHPSAEAELRTDPSLRVKTFQAYIGALYLDSGLDVVDTWISSIFRQFVDEQVRRMHPTPTAPVTPITPSPFVSYAAPPTLWPAYDIHNDFTTPQFSPPYSGVWVG